MPCYLHCLCIRPPVAEHVRLPSAVTIPVFFDKFLIHTMPFADVLPWDEISVTLDFNDIFEGNRNALDELSKHFSVERALAMARKASSDALT